MEGGACDFVGGDVYGVDFQKVEERPYAAEARFADNKGIRIVEMEPPLVVKDVQSGKVHKVFHRCRKGGCGEVAAVLLHLTKKLRIFRKQGLQLWPDLYLNDKVEHTPSLRGYLSQLNAFKRASELEDFVFPKDTFAHQLLFEETLDPMPQDLFRRANSIFE